HRSQLLRDRAVPQPPVVHVTEQTAHPARGVIMVDAEAAGARLPAGAGDRALPRTVYASAPSLSSPSSPASPSAGGCVSSTSSARPICAVCGSSGASLQIAGFVAIASSSVVHGDNGLSLAAERCRARSTSSG